MLPLDRQVLLWLLDDNPRLGQAARATIGDSTQVHFSAATVRELTIQSMLGKLTVPTALTTTLVAQGLEPLHVTGEQAETMREFPELSRHDPFDRLIVSQASRCGSTLLTADEVLLELDRNFVVDARR